MIDLRPRLPFAAVLFAMLLALVFAPAARAEHPFIAEADEKNWHAPLGSDEAVFIGDAAAGEPRVVLKRAPIQAGMLLVQIQTDAPRVALVAGEKSMSLPLDSATTAKLGLSGDPLHPTIRWNDKELLSERGKWIALFVRNEAPTLTLSFPKATFVNLRFNPRAANPQAEAPTVQTLTVKSTSPTTLPAGQREPNVAERDRDRLSTPAGSDDYLGPRHDAWTLFGSMTLNSVSSYYFRGIGQENEGVILQPDLVMNLRIYEGETNAWFNSLDLNIDIKTSSHWSDETGRDANSGGRRKWYEFDLIGGATATIFDRWALSLLSHNRTGPNNQLSDVHEVNLKVAFDDSTPQYDWSLQPYALLALEFQNESDAGNFSAPGTSEGIYVELGLRPRFKLTQLGLSRPVILTVPVTLGLSVADYYEDGTGQDDFFGFFDIGADLYIPLFAKPEGRSRHEFEFFLNLGLHAIFFGDSVQTLNGLNGTGDTSGALVGTIGFGIKY